VGKWTGRAAAFADSYAHLCAHTAPAALEAAGLAPGVRLLDVGTGTGTVAALGAAGGARVTAVDTEPGMVELTRASVPGAEVIEAGLPDLPLPDAAFDAVVANFVLNHVTDPGRAAAELLRLTAPGGRVAVTVWPRPSPPLQQLWTDVMAAVGLTPAPSIIPPELDFARTTGGVTALLTGAGLGDVTCRTINWSHRTDVESWWIGPSNGMGALGEALAGRDASTVAAARRAYERLAAPYVQHDGTLALPTAALLAHGARPRLP
jgi:SAM-dependent methyltransferase